MTPPLFIILSALVSGCALVGCATNPANPPRDDAGLPTPTYDREAITLDTPDGLTLVGELHSGDHIPPGAPAVLLLHQFLQDHQQWGELPSDLVDQGYKVLAISFRGHGESADYGGPLEALLNDPLGAPRDVDGALDFLAQQTDVDAERVAIIGTSVGANVALASAVQGKARTYVSISARRPPTEALAAAPVEALASVFFVASEDDSGDQAADSRAMFDAATTPRELHVYPGASHGIGLLNAERVDLVPRLVSWLEQTL